MFDLLSCETVMFPVNVFRTKIIFKVFNKINPLSKQNPKLLISLDQFSDQINNNYANNQLTVKLCDENKSLQN